MPVAEDGGVGTAAAPRSISSFDVFDTVITRPVGSPTGLFLLLGRRIVDAGLVATPQRFARARLEAEERVLGRLGARTTTEAIYAELADALALTRAQAAEAATMEAELEAQLARSVPAGVAAVAAARAERCRIVYVSDMHLPEAVVARLLTSQGLLEPDDGLYVSSRVGCAKWSGELFRALLAAEGVSPTTVRHLGNDRHADLVCPARLGIDARHDPACNLNRYERLLDGHAWGSGGLSSVLAGASRLARLSVPATGTRRVALRDVSASVVAPLLVAFVLWALRRADQLGLKRLYFLSRDGQVLLRLAQQLAPRLGSDVDLRYLHISRHVVSAAAVGRGGGTDWRLIETQESSSPRNIALQLGVDAEDVAMVLRGLGLGGHLDHTELPRLDRRRLLDGLRTDPDLGRRIRQAAAKQRRLLVGYLAQEGVGGADPIGLVDVGWRGTIQHSLEQLLAEEGSHTVLHGLYLGADPPVEPAAEVRHREAYLFDNVAGRGFPDLADSHRTMLEVFCSGDHGAVTGYRRCGGRVVPVLRSASNDAVLAWGLPLVRATLDAFAAALPLDLDVLDPRADLRPAVGEVLHAFLCRPGRAEAEAWGAHPVQPDPAGLYTLPFGQPYTRRQLVVALARGRREPHHRYLWHGGSLAMSSPDVRAALRGLAGLRAWLRAARRRPGPRRQTYDRGDLSAHEGTADGEAV